MIRHVDQGGRPPTRVGEPYNPRVLAWYDGGTCESATDLAPSGRGAGHTSSPLSVTAHVVLAVAETGRKGAGSRDCARTDTGRRHRAGVVGRDGASRSVAETRSASVERARDESSWRRASSHCASPRAPSSATLPPRRRGRCSCSSPGAAGASHVQASAGQRARGSRAREAMNVGARRLGRLLGSRVRLSELRHGAEVAAHRRNEGGVHRFSG
jgi:hypothetical protein